MDEHISYSGTLLGTAARDPERHYSIADHGSDWVSTFCIGDKAVPMNLKTHETIAVARKQKGLTTKPAMPPIETKKDRGSLAMCARTTRWRSEADSNVTPHLRRKPRPI